MASFTVIYDACLFYPAPLRDLMIRLAQTRGFHARWTEEIQRAALENPPLSAETFIDTLRRQGLPGVAGLLQSQIALI